MNDEQFKHHLKDLAHGHHHPEEHEWDQQRSAPRKPAAKSAVTKGRAVRKPARKK